MCRYQSGKYKKKINDRIAIEDFLKDKISEHKDAAFPFSDIELDNLRYEELHEILIPTINKSINVDLSEGQDWDNEADSKFAIARKNSTNQSKHSAAIASCGTKKFILATVYEPISSKFYHFAFPPWAGSHDVSFDPYTGAPIKARKNKVTQIWRYEVNSIEALAFAKINLVEPSKKVTKPKKKWNREIFNEV